MDDDGVVYPCTADGAPDDFAINITVLGGMHIWYA